MRIGSVIFVKKSENILLKWAMRLYVIFAVIFVFIYVIFAGRGFISAGINLTRKDWLAFIGSYLSFIGTVCVSLITIYQTHFYKVKDNEQQKTDRVKKIEPIFSLEIIECEENPLNLKLKNVGEFPARNVSLNNTYYYELFATNDERIIYFNDNQKEFVSDYGANEYEYPKTIVINYEDVDGNNGHMEYEYRDDIVGCEYGYYKLKNKSIDIEGEI